jgi:hypothetical protein
MFARLLAAAAAVVLLGTSAFADAVGKYSIRGTNPGDGKPYSGEVTVTKTGETFRVVWLIGSDPYTGTGIGSDDFLAVSYRSAAKPAWRCTAASPTANGTDLDLRRRPPDRNRRLDAALTRTHGAIS